MNPVDGDRKRTHEFPGPSSKAARAENADSPLHSPVLSEEDMSLDPPTFHAVKLRFHFMDALENSKILTDWQWKTISNLLERVVSNHGILLLNDETLNCFRVDKRVHFGRLATFLQLSRNPECPIKMRKWTHVDPTPFTPEERAEAIFREHIPLWRPALLTFTEGDVTIKRGRFTAIGFRCILKGCQVFETILANHPDEKVIHMEGIEPFLLSAAFVWSYCKPFPRLMNSVKTADSLPPPKDPYNFLNLAPEWLQEATDAAWWQNFFSLYKPDRLLNCIPLALSHRCPAIRSGCEHWVNGLVEKFLTEMPMQGKKPDLEHTLYKAARYVSRLNAAPNQQFSLDKLRLWCPNLITLRLQLSDPLHNRTEKTFHFPKLVQLEAQIILKTYGPPLLLDCLAGCPRLESLKIEAFSSPKLLCRFHKPPSAQFLPHLRILELANLYLGGPSDNDAQKLFSAVSGMAKLEELTLRNLEGLTAEDIRKLAPLKELRVLKIIFDTTWGFKDDMIEAVAELRSLAHLELDPLSERHYDLFAKLSENKR